MRPDPPQPRRSRWSFALILGSAALLFVGCKHLGPQTIQQDRSDYSSSIAESWKQQTLLNIVKLRYLDLPIFVDVASVVSGYSLETAASVGGQISSAGAIQGNNLVLGAQGKYTDRPTITYVPLTGEKFLRGLLTPIDPTHVFFMLQAGYAADFVLGLTVESLNGVNNRSTAAGALREADPKFIRVLELLRELQAAGAFGMRVEEDKARGSTGVIFFRRENVPAEVAEKATEVRRLLGLSPTRDKFTLVYSPVPGAEGELAVTSRSMIQIMMAFASYAEVPEAHLKDRRALPGPGPYTGAVDTPVRIRCTEEEPADAFASVRYRDHWFWIDDRDWRSKRAFTAIMFFFTLAEGGGPERLPLITIPAQ